MDRLHYHYHNRQQPVLLLLHGFLGSMEQWRYLEEQALSSYSILKIDLPGHGKTLEFHDGYDLNRLSLMLDDILIKEKIDRVHVVGHSMGGYLGCAFAKARPEKTISLTLINSIASPDSAERKLLRNRSIELIEKHQAAYVSMAIGNLFTHEEKESCKNRIMLMKQQANQISVKSIIQALECMRDRENSLPRLKESKFPINYIYGKKDAIAPIELVEKEVLLLGANGKIIDSGHMSLLTTTFHLAQNVYFIE